MSNIFLLGANRSIDTSKQVVEVNQIIRMEGYSYDKYVLHVAIAVPVYINTSILMYIFTTAHHYFIAFVLFSIIQSL
ncbi:MAG: hypothetical protein LBV74_20155, partial [Tannerella sp.]|nr:hypothetical protein [Tannerella sp.]